MQIVNDIRAAEDAIAKLLAAGRAERKAAAQAEAAERERVAAENKRKRCEVIRAIRVAVVSDGQVPAALCPYMRTAGLADDGACPDGSVTLTVSLPPHPEGYYVAFNVVRGGDGTWSVSGEWMAASPTGGTKTYPTFAQAVAAEIDERIPY